MKCFLIVEINNVKFNVKFTRRLLSIKETYEVRMENDDQPFDFK